MKPHKFKFLGWYIYYGEYGFFASKCPNDLINKITDSFYTKGDNK